MLTTICCICKEYLDLQDKSNVQTKNGMAHFKCVNKKTTRETINSVLKKMLETAKNIELRTKKEGDKTTVEFHHGENHVSFKLNTKKNKKFIRGLKVAFAYLDDMKEDED